MEKAPQPPGEAERLEALLRLKVLDTPPEERFDRLTRLAQSLLGVPTALVSLSDAERQWFKSRQGFTAPHFPRDVSFCAHAILGKEPFVVPDAANDYRFRDSPLVVAEPKIRFYAGAPLRLMSGETMGTLCVLDRIPRAFDKIRIGLLRDLAALVSNELEGASPAVAIAALRRREEEYKALLAEQSDLVLRVTALTRTERRLAARLAGAAALKDASSRPAALDAFARAVANAMGWSSASIREAEAAPDPRGPESEKASIPVRLDGKVECVLEFAGAAIDRDALAGIGEQLADYLRVRRDDREAARVKEALHASTIAVATDAAGRITFANDAFAALTGYAREELLGKTHRILKSGVHPDGFFRTMWQAISSGMTWSGEICNRGKSGALYWVHSTITPFTDEDGKPREHLAVMHDITERKLWETRAAEAEDRLRVILDSATHVAVIGADAAGLVTVFNKGAERLLGFAAAEMLGKPAPVLHLDAEADGAEKYFARKDGTKLPVRLSVTALRGRNREITGFLGIAVDGTGDQDARRELANARAAALELAAAKSRFLSKISRELRGPMNTISGGAGRLLDADLAPPQRELAETVRARSEALLAVVGDILDFSRLEAGDGALEETEFDPRLVVEDVASVFASRAQDKGLELAAVVEDGVPAGLRGDVSRLRQVLGALADNAVRYTETGSVVLGLRRLGEERGAVRMRFEIKDSGPGLDDAARARLFTPFAQDAEVHGAGLGLASAKKLVEMMKGTIGAESAPGRGSTFWFEVPLAKGTLASPAEPPALAGVKVLIIDAGEVARRVTAALASSWRMRPHAVPDAASALAALREAEAKGDPFILALIDWRLPDMDGGQLAREIKDDATLVAVRMLLLGPSAALPEPGEAAALGFDGALAKPVLRAPLLEAITAALSRKAGGPVAEAGAPALASPLKGLRVLIAEDNAFDRGMTLARLRELGCRADAVADGREALAAAAQVPYDLVLMDCLMPELDGYAAAGAVRARPGCSPALKIIGMTSDLEPDRGRCAAAGMDDVVTKPVRAEDLNAALRRKAA